MYQVQKRDGSIADFHIDKIGAAITKAFDAVHAESHPSVIDMLALKVTSDFSPKITNGLIRVEDIQDSAEQQKVEIDRYKAEIDAYNAETKRIAAVQNSMTPEQIQDIVMGTIAAALDTGDLIGGAPEMREMPEAEEAGEAPEMTPEMPEMPEGMAENEQM